jgi:hypothetical protein
MVRIDAKGSKGQYAMYFHCQTDLVETFRDRYSDRFKFEKNRAIIFEDGAAVPAEELRHCISLALTYHRDRSGRAKSRSRQGK